MPFRAHLALVCRISGSHDFRVQFQKLAGFILALVCNLGFPAVTAFPRPVFRIRTEGRYLVGMMISVSLTHRLVPPSFL